MKNTILKVGLFADPHYSTQELVVLTRKPKLSASKLKEAIAAFILEEVSAVICLGDLINGEENDEVNTDNLRTITTPLLDLRRKNINVYCIRGNHDAEIFDEAEFSDISGLVIAPHSISREGIRMIMIDASFTSDGQPYKKRDIDWTDTYIGGGQINWLDQQLCKSEALGESVYIFTHQNLDPNVERHHIISNAAEVRKIIEKYKCVRAVYQGHYHKGAHNICGGIPYISLPAMCEGLNNQYMIAELQ